jgi:hypothetical protein
MIIKKTKEKTDTSKYLPFETASVWSGHPSARILVARDAIGRVYTEKAIRPGHSARFAVRGSAGRHVVSVCGESGNVLEEASFVLEPHTGITCDTGPYAALMKRLQQMIQTESETHPWIINGRIYNLLICWSRDHVYTLKAAKYFIDDVTSGLDYFLDSQEPSGMFWDCIYRNTEEPGASWFGEALGKGWYRYDDGMKYIVRRVPVLADTEYVFAEGVWAAWKAAGDDAWMAKQLPRLEKALKYMTTDPLRWSGKHGLVRRSFTADEWDFANPHYCAGDHRCIHPGDPTFFFHGNNSGLYAMYWRMAEMYEYLGDKRRAKELRRDGEGLRGRANAKLFFDTQYGHMIPETLAPEKVYALVGDERKRMSLSTGYTINRGLPTHEMAVKIIREYQRRAKAKRKESFAEWWTIDPSYTPGQWPGQECPQGEYMNGGICGIVAGEIAKAAFDHGCEKYGVDIIDRIWKLVERDGGELHEVYRQLPEKPCLPKTRFHCVDLCAAANRGLKNGAHKGIKAWTDEGDNDMRNLPVGRHAFGNIQFDVPNPARNGGRAIVHIDADSAQKPDCITIPIGGRKCVSLYFLHAIGRSVIGRQAGGRGSVVATYDILYADGVSERIYVRDGHEIRQWWGVSDDGMNRAATRCAWRGKNPQWKNVGMFMNGWNNTRPRAPIKAIRIEAVHGVCQAYSILLAGITLSDKPVEFEPRIQSYGLPASWTQAAVYHAIAEGLAGIEDRGSAFSEVSVSPRWPASKARRAQVTLHYPASNGYCSYKYRLDSGKRQIFLDLTGSFKRVRAHCLLPEGKKANSVAADGRELPFKNLCVERSRYVDFVLDSLPRGVICIKYGKENVFNKGGKR